MAVFYVNLRAVAQEVLAFGNNGLSWGQAADYFYIVLACKAGFHSALSGAGLGLAAALFNDVNHLIVAFIHNCIQWHPHHSAALCCGKLHFCGHSCTKLVVGVRNGNINGKHPGFFVNNR